MLAEIFTFIVLAIIGGYFLRRVLETQQLDNLGDLPVLITGCDSGFGYNLALKCIRNGMPVFAACFTQNGIARLTEEAKGVPNGGDLLNCFQMDVSDDQSVANGVAFVEAKLKGRFKGLFAVVNNAGISSATVFDEMCSLDDYQQAWNVNALGVIRVTHAFIRLVKPMRGRIIIMASVCGRVGLPGLGPYTVSKFAVEGYGDVLRAEMSIFGVKVIIMEPGFFKTALASYDRVGKLVNEHWERLPETLKAEYGKALFDYQTGVLLTTLQNASPDTEATNNAYFHALTAKWPRPRYHVGVDANFVFIPFASLPTAAQDCYLWVNALMSGRPRPAAAVRAAA